MIIKKISNAQWQIKSKDTIIKLDGGIQVGEYKIPGSGEYEVAGIEIEVIDGITNLVIENVNLVFLAKTKKELSESELKQLSNVDILFLPVAGAETMNAKKALSVLSEIEPTIVIPTYYEKLEEFTKSAGITAQELPQLKIGKNNLPEEEERKVIIL